MNLFRITDRQTAKNNQSAKDGNNQSGNVPKEHGNDFDHQMAIHRYGQCKGQIRLVCEKRHVKTVDDQYVNGNVDCNHQ